MKKILVIFFLVISFSNLHAQLKAENYLFIDSANHKISANNLKTPVRSYTIYNTGFKYEKDLHFFSYLNSAGMNFCCNYYEVKSIPKQWNIIGVKDIVSYMEDKTSGFRFKEKKLFFVEYDKGRKIYKAYQVEIIVWPRED